MFSSFKPILQNLAHHFKNNITYKQRFVGMQICDLLNCINM